MKRFKTERCIVVGGHEVRFLNCVLHRPELLQNLSVLIVNEGEEDKSL